MKDLPFLDTLIYFNTSGSLNTILYKKPTDVCFLLHAQSFHPSSSKTGIIYSQAIRYSRIITTDEDLTFHLKQLFNTLVSRGYDPTLIQSIVSKVLTKSQADLLSEKETQQKQILPFVIPFNINTTPIGPILHQYWNTITKDTTLGPIHHTWPDSPRHLGPHEIIALLCKCTLRFSTHLCYYSSSILLFFSRTLF